MNPCLTRRAALLAAAFSLSAATLPSRAAGATYQFSPVNQYGIQVTAAYWNPIIDYVSEKSGVQLRLKIGRTSADTTAYVLAQEVDFVFTNHLFSPEREALGWKVFGRRMTPPLHGQIVVPADSPIRSIRDLVDYAKANPEKFTYGSTGIGTSPHLAVEEFAQRAGIKLLHVPFKGNADNMQAVLGGHTMAASDATGWGPHVDAGKLRLLATYGSKRTKRWPNVPTLDELGYKTVSDSPFGVCGPKGMDAGVVKTLHDAFKKTLEDPAVLATFDKYDQTVIYMDTDAYTKWARETYEAERATIQRLGMAKAG